MKLYCSKTAIPKKALKFLFKNLLVLNVLSHLYLLNLSYDRIVLAIDYQHVLVLIFPESSIVLGQNDKLWRTVAYDSRKILTFCFCLHDYINIQRDTQLWT